jgi:hypothetical protein
MSKSGYVVCGQSFKTKSALKQYISSMTQQYEVGEIINKADQEFMSEILSWHPRSKAKIGSGIKAFKIIETPHGTIGVELIRTDGSTTDFSYYKCIDGESKIKAVKAACRAAVADDIISFKRAIFKSKAKDEKIQCPFTGEWVGFSEAHVDHIPPQTFESIFQDWIEKNSIDPETVEIEGFGDNEFVKSFKDKRLSTSFREFHNKYAKLRITSALGNLSHSKKEKNH